MPTDLNVPADLVRASGERIASGGALGPGVVVDRHGQEGRGTQPEVGLEHPAQVRRVAESGRGRRAGQVGPARHGLGGDPQPDPEPVAAEGDADLAGEQMGQA